MPGWWWASGLAADPPGAEDPLACKWCLSAGQEGGMEKNRLVEESKDTKKEINKVLQMELLNPWSFITVDLAYR